MKSTRMTLAIVATAMIAVAATAVPASAWTYHNRYYACTLDGGFSTSATAWNTLSANASCTIAGDNNGPVTSSVELPRTVSGTLSLSGGTSLDGCAGAPANAGTLSLSGDLLLSDGEKFLVNGVGAQAASGAWVLTTQEYGRDGFVAQGEGGELAFAAKNGSAQALCGGSRSAPVAGSLRFSAQVWT